MRTRGLGPLAGLEDHASRAWPEHDEASWWHAAERQDQVLITQAPTRCPTSQTVSSRSRGLDGASIDRRRLFPTASTRPGQTSSCLPPTPSEPAQPPISRGRVSRLGLGSRARRRVWPDWMIARAAPPSARRRPAASSHRPHTGDRAVATSHAGLARAAGRPSLRRWHRRPDPQGGPVARRRSAWSIADAGTSAVFGTDRDALPVGCDRR